MKKQDTVILYSYFRKARVRQDFVGVMRQVACVRSPESIENPLCARVRRPKTKPDTGIDEPRHIQSAGLPPPQEGRHTVAERNRMGCAPKYIFK